MSDESTELSEVYEQLSAANNVIAGLAAWECQGCGARFASRVAPEMLKGVTLCSSCMKVKALTQQLIGINSAYTKLSEHMRARSEQITELEADINTARARIALLEVRLAALCGAVEGRVQERQSVGRNATDDVLKALTAAREVLGG